MFAANSYKPTFSGPMLASGEQLRRGKNSAMQQSAFAGNQRAYLPRNTGVRAGSKMADYQSGLQADAAMAKGYAEAQRLAQADQLYNAGATQRYQQNRAGEDAFLQNLLLGQRRIDEGSALDMAGIDTSEMLSQRQREVQEEAARLNRQASVGGILARLFG